MWWWVLTRPGVTRQPDASIVSAAAGGGSVDEPTPDTRPPVIAPHPPGRPRPARGSGRDEDGRPTLARRPRRRYGGPGQLRAAAMIRADSPGLVCAVSM